MSLSTNEASLELALSTDQALERLAEAAEDSGAAWQREGPGGRLDLPIAAGLRHGWLRTRVSVVALDAHRSRLEFQTEEEVLALHRPAVIVLALAALGALIVSLWPFFPKLIPLAPIAAILAVVGWLMVGSHLQNRGLREFLEVVRDPTVE